MLPRANISSYGQLPKWDFLAREGREKSPINMDIAGHKVAKVEAAAVIVVVVPDTSEEGEHEIQQSHAVKVVNEE